MPYPYYRKPYARYSRPVKRYSRRSKMPRKPMINLRNYSAALNQQDYYYTIASREIQVSSGVGGSVSNIVAFSSINGATNWSSWAAIFDEFRVEAVKLTYTPALPNSTSATFAPVYTIFDEDGGTAPTDPTQYPTAKSHRLDQSWTQLYTIPTDLESRISYYNTANPTVQAETIYLVSNSSLSISQLYGNLHIQYFVKFRGGR